MNPWLAVPATLALVYRSWKRNSLTPLGIVFAVITAAAHAIHPWSVFFALLAVFFLAGTFVTKVKHDVKTRLTHSSTGSPDGQPRTHVQVLANSLVASILIVIHAISLASDANQGVGKCYRRGAWPRTSDVLVAGIVANYAAVAADTFSSELGILATSKPRLITAPWRTVPPGTNGGVTATGIHAGLLGSFIISATAALLLPFCSASTFDQTGTLGGGVTTVGWSIRSRINFTLTLTLVGACGSLLDSVLGALLQASVVDVRTGKIIEGDGGGKVLVHSAGSLHMRQAAKIHEHLGTGDGASAVPEIPSELKKRSVAETATTNKDGSARHQESRKVEVGNDILSNNGVNLLMAATMSFITVLGTAWLWNVPLSRVLG